MTEKWCEIQGKLDLAQVSGVFKLSKLELLKFYCIWKKQKKKKRWGDVRFCLQYFTHNSFG